MKFLLLIILCTGFTAGAQTNDKPVKLVHYALDSFRNGHVRMKSGETHNQVLNYNLVTQEMIFELNGNYLAIANPREVDTVYIGQRKFIPVSDAFYEWLGGSNVALFLEYACTIREQGANTGFGTTNTTAATPVKALLKDGGAYKLKLPDDYEIVRKETFFIRKNDRFYRVSNEQQIARLFPEKKDIIRKWVKENKTRFSDPRDMALLVEQIQ